MQQTCANCGTLLHGKCTGESAIYERSAPEIKPKLFGIILCEQCFLLEDDLIDQQGTNELPERLRHYHSMLARNEI